MKLFYIPSSCALAVHIAVHEADLDVELVPIDVTATGKVAAGVDFLSINPKDKSPAMAVDGQILTETQVILQFLADRAPHRLAFPSDGWPRWRMLELLNFVTTELHRGFGPLFSPDIAPAHRAALIAALMRNFALLEDTLGDQPFLTGEEFTVADAYAWTVMGWTAWFEFDLSPFPKLAAWRARVADRPAVRRALKEQGITG